MQVASVLVNTKLVVCVQNYFELNVERKPKLKRGLFVEIAIF